MFCFSSAEEGTEASRPVLQLKPAELALRKGRSARITASVANLPKGVRAGKYEWTSSDPGVVEWRDGAARGAGGGDAVLTCSVTLSDGMVLTADCPVTVTVPVSGVSIPAQVLTVMAGDTFTPEVRVLPDDATNSGVLVTVSDESILSAGPDGQVTALTVGKAYLTFASEEDPTKKARLTVTVTERIGRADTELTFLGIPWESDCDTCIRLLKEKGFVAQETRDRSIYTGTAWHWPETDLLFSRTSAWRTLPVSFSDSRTGAGRISLNPQMTIGGFLPQVSTLVFLNGVNSEGQVETGITRLIGVYFSFDNRHESGAVIFSELLKRLESQYGKFRRYLSKDIPRYYQELYEQIGTDVAGAEEYSVQEPGIDVYLGEYAFCTIRGTGHTGIMLSIDTNEAVTLFYGRTDATELIQELQEQMKEGTDIMEDAGV